MTAPRSVRKHEPELAWPDDYLIPGVEPYHVEEAGIIYCGDSLELMPRLHGNSIDSFITDPPFAMAGGISCGSSSQLDTQFFLHWWTAIASEIHRIGKPEHEGFIWCDWKTAAIVAKGFKPKNQRYDFSRISQMLYHYREMPGQGKPFRSSVDLIAYLRGPKSTGERIANTTHNFISKYWYYGKHENHPSEKDPDMAKQFILWCTDEGNIICDPFMGSGTVAIAAQSLGRRFICCDLEKEHCATAVKRLRQGVLPYA